ncbi:ArnT family glycosyltransferase [Nocardioides montaniterrae]
MAAVIDRPHVDVPPSPEVLEPSRPTLREKLLRNRASLAVVAALLLVAGTVQAWGMYAAPERVDDEGTYVAQAYALEHFHQLAHYTYWYDHPPLGWLQIALWTTLTDGFGRVVPAVMAGREAMLVAQLVSVVLLWLLARRMRLSRPAAALGVLLFSLSPVAVAFHRMVFLDNVAMPWLLGAFVLAAPRRRELMSLIGAAACFAVAVLTKETLVLLAPALLWWAWSNAHRATRRYTFTVAGSLFAMLCLGYVVFAALRGELLPGAGHVSLVDGIKFQLFTRQSSGFVLERGTQAFATVAIWLHYDAFLLAAGVIAAVVLLGHRRLRPLAFALLLQVVLLLRPGYLPVPYVIGLLPFAALAIAAFVEVGVRRGGWRRSTAVLAAVAVALVAVPSWATGLHRLTTQDQDRPMASAERWLETHAPRNARLLVDDAVWVDLVRSGRPRQRVVWYYKADTDPAVMRLTPHGWRDYSYVLVTESMRRSLATQGTAPGGGAYPVLVGAFQHSRLVSAYGHGMDRVEVRRVVAGPQRSGGDR